MSANGAAILLIIGIVLYVGGGSYLAYAFMLVGGIGLVASAFRRGK